MLRIGVLVSGGGTNLQAIIDGCESGYIDGRVVAVISSNPKAFALERAARHGIPASCMRRGDFPEGGLTDAIIGRLRAAEVGLVLLAGFMLILDEKFIAAFPNRVMNIHPSLIPAFCGEGLYGLRPHAEALRRGVKITGATVHFVNEVTDGGPIILQKAVAVEDGDTPELLQKRVMEQAEQVIYPEAVKLFAEGRLTVAGGRVRIEG